MPPCPHAFNGRPSAAPPKSSTDQTLRNVRRFLRLRSVLRHPKAKLILLRMLGDSVNDAIDFAVGEHVKAAHPTLAVRDTSDAAGILADRAWERFWPGHPKRVRERETRALFFPLPWHDTRFAEAFFAGLERWKRSAQWADPRFIQAPDKWIREERWNEFPPEDPRFAEEAKKQAEAKAKADAIRRQLDEQEARWRKHVDECRAAGKTPPAEMTTWLAERDARRAAHEAGRNPSESEIRAARREIEEQLKAVDPEVREWIYATGQIPPDLYSRAQQLPDHVQSALIAEFEKLDRQAPKSA